MTIRKFLDLSTMHTTPEDLAALPGESSVAYIGECGAVVWTGLQFGPPSILKACEIARARYPGVDYLMFDADAPINRDFPKYEKEWDT